MAVYVAVAILTLTVCAAPAAAQQPAPVPAPPGTTGPLPPPTQQPEQPATPPAEGQPAPQAGRVMAADAGLIFFPVKPERVADFEKIMAKLKEALATSEDPVRREQAIGWKVFKAVEPGPNNTVLYVFMIDPAVKGSDYAFWKTLYDAFPKEVQELYRLYNAAAAGGQSLLNLHLLQDFSSEPPK